MSVFADNKCLQYMKWFELIIYVCAESVLMSFNLLFSDYSFGKVTSIEKWEKILL